MNDVSIIKDQIKKMRDLAINNNPIVKEQITDIKKKYLIKEDNTEKIDTKQYNVPQSISDDFEEGGPKKNESEQSYRISGGVLTIHGDSNKDTELTTDDKLAFQETMDEFVSEVSDLVDFETLNVYKTDVEWGGKIIDFDIEFYFTIGENNGIYINGTMIKVDENFTEMLGKLQSYYEKFKTKWAQVMASRKKTSPRPE